eukprot:5781965-Pyramimonas_sp.AAC.1
MGALVAALMGLLIFDSADGHDGKHEVGNAVDEHAGWNADEHAGFAPPSGGVTSSSATANRDAIRMAGRAGDSSALAIDC